MTDVSKAVADGMVPYWQSAHSLMRDVTVSGSSIVQRPAAGSFEPLRTSVNPLSFGPISVSKSSGGGECCHSFSVQYRSVLHSMHDCFCFSSIVQ